MDLHVRNMQNDMQSSLSFTTYSYASSSKMAHCLGAIGPRMKNRWLKLDSSKTEVTLVDREKHFREFATRR